ncbi:acetyl-CoA carboxylase biotin carboxyl carrier protein subunit [Rummeliibacillus sp. JY-2-4R]
MTEVLATMAGMVFHIDVHVGDEVTVGQTVVILESMKMEIPIEATVAGKVSEIRIQEGDFVNEDDVLVILT